MAATNLIFEKPWRIQQGEQTWRFEHVGMLHVAEWIQLSGLRTRLLISPIRDSSEKRVEERAWFDFDGQARLLAFALAFEERIAQISHSVGEALLPSMIVATNQLGKLANGMVFLRYRVDAAQGLQAQGYLACPPAILQQFRSMAQAPSIPLAQALRAVIEQVSVSLQLKPLTLAVSEYQSLRAGDVLGLGARSLVSDEGCVSIRGLSYHGAWRCSFYADGWHLVRKALQMEFMDVIEDAMSAEEINEQETKSGAPGLAERATIASDAQEAPGSPTVALTQKLEIQIGFELARVNLPLHDLAQLQAGYVFKLNAPVEGQNVRIISNGRLVGVGELVSVGDFLGVRLLELQ
jgi:type III secretion protein Q